MGKSTGIPRKIHWNGKEFHWNSTIHCNTGKINWNVRKNLQKWQEQSPGMSVLSTRMPGKYTRMRGKSTRMSRKSIELPGKSIKLPRKSFGISGNYTEILGKSITEEIHFNFWEINWNAMDIYKTPGKSSRLPEWSTGMQRNPLEFHGKSTEIISNSPKMLGISIGMPEKYMGTPGNSIEFPG